MGADGRATALVLGGGVGGLVAAHRLRRSLPPRCRVVLVEREARHVFAPSLLWVMTGQRSAAAVSRPLAGLERKGIEVVRGEIEAIDPVRRSARVDGSTLTAEFLVLALGADFAPEVVPGLAEVVARNIVREVTGRGAAARFDGHGECFVETGGGRAGYGSGDFYAEPVPRVTLRGPARHWHLGKVLFEKSWLWRWF